MLSAPNHSRQPKEAYMSSTTIYLYIKTHKDTGLKYFGKTIKSDYEKYRGSGTYWKNHIAKHGYNVTTEIVFQSENIEEVEEFALAFSKENDIVESKEWANLTLETGRDGSAVGPSADTRKKMSKSHKKHWSNDEYRKKMGEIHTGRKHSEKTKKKMSIKRKKYLSNYENRKKLSESWTPERRAEQSKISSKRNKEWWANLSPERKKEIVNKSAESNRGKISPFRGISRSNEDKISISSGTKEAMTDPKLREHLSKKAKARCTKEWRQRVAENNKRQVCCITCGYQTCISALGNHRKGKRCKPTNFPH